MKAINDTCLRASVRLHNILPRFCAVRETGTEILELNIMQELTSVEQETIFLVLLDLRKAYDTIYCGCLLTILEGYGAGPTCVDTLKNDITITFQIGLGKKLRKTGLKLVD